MVFRHAARTLILAALVMLIAPLPLAAQEEQGTLVVRVRSDAGPVDQADVQAGTMLARTDASGVATIELPPDKYEVTVTHFGFETVKARTTIVAGATSTLPVGTVCTAAA